MKKLLATAMVSAMIILPASAQQPAKYELGNYNFSFDKEEVQNVEFKSTETPVAPQVAPLTQSEPSKPVILPSLPNGKPVVVDEKIKPVAESIDAQKQVVKQIKQEEQTTEEVKGTEQIAPTEPKKELIEQTQNEQTQEEPQVAEPQEQELQLPHDKEEIKTPLPQSSVTPSAEDLKLKTNLPPKTHTPMPNQKVLDETHSVTAGETPVKRVVQPTKAPAKEPQRPKYVEEEQLEEITLTQEEKAKESAATETQAADRENKVEKADKTEQGAKSEDQKVKEKKKLPFTFELQKMQYNGVESRQL